MLLNQMEHFWLFHRGWKQQLNKIFKNIYGIDQIIMGLLQWKLTSLAPSLNGELSIFILNLNRTTVMSMFIVVFKLKYKACARQKCTWMRWYEGSIWHSCRFLSFTACQQLHLVQKSNAAGWNCFQNVCNGPSSRS